MSKLTAIKNSIFPTQATFLPVKEDNVPVYDVTPFASEIDLTHLDVIHTAPVWMTRAERLLIYTLAFTLRPLRYLEIGTFQGGSALMVSAALDSLNSDAKMVCVDPTP